MRIRTDDFVSSGRRLLTSIGENFDSWRAWLYEKATVGKKQIIESDSFREEIIDELENNREKIYFFKVGHNKIPVFLFRDHDSSYNSWCWYEYKHAANLARMSIVHIDAHADLPWNQEVEKFPKPSNADEALEKRAGFSTYLIPACVDGYTGKLYWLRNNSRDEELYINPQHNIANSRASVEVISQGDGIPYQVSSTPGSLVSQWVKSEHSNGYSLDIDLDYFLDNLYLSKGNPRERFEELLEGTLMALMELKKNSGIPKCVTIAYSPAYCSYKEWAKHATERIFQTLSEM